MYHYWHTMLMLPSFGVVLVLIWMTWRAGQFRDPQHVASLPMRGEGPDTVLHPRLKVTLIALAIVAGIGVGTPIATAIISARATVTEPVQTQEHVH